MSIPPAVYIGNDTVAFRETSRGNFMRNIKRKPIAESIVLVQYSVNVMISCIRETGVSD
jgi:hypothetical protein